MHTPLYIAALALVLLVPRAQAADDVDALQYLHAVAGTQYHRLESEHTGRGYHLFVLSPPDAEDGPYPVIYLLDGGGLFPMLAGYHRYLVLSGEVAPAVIVGISYGSESFEGGNYRATDYTAPSPERAWYGGAGAYQDFLADELLPFVEARYPADPARRIVFGHSLGGQFVLYSAQTRPALFHGHLASNPALHRNLPFFLQTRPPADAGAARLFVGAGADDEEQYRVPRDAWLAHWQKAGPPWRFEYREYDGHSHMTTPPVVFRDGLRWLVPGTNP